MDWFRAELQAVHDEQLAKLRAAAKAERATLATLARRLPRDDENERDQTD